MGIIILLFLSGLVSGSEVAFFSLNENDYEEFAANPSPATTKLIELKEYPRRLLATILIANNFINIAIVLISELLLTEIFQDGFFRSWASTLLTWIESLRGLDGNIPLENVTQLATVIRFTITIVGVTFLLVLFGEVAPKVYARMNRVQLAKLMARPVGIMLSLFAPISAVLVNGAAVIERQLESRSNDNSTVSQQDIDEAIDLTVQQEENGEDGQPQDVYILKRIVLFANATVRQIMRSRVDVVAVDQSIGYHELLEKVREHSYSRIPVFEDDFDKVRGILYVKDLLGYRYEAADFDWHGLIRQEILYVPENKKVSELLKQFQQEKMHMAIVVDEYGGTEGIVTLEDVMEEVIGDIQDEFDEGDEIVFNKVDDLNYEFDGKTLLNDVCRVLEMSTSTFDEVKGDAESLAGLVLEHVGKLPEPNQEIKVGEYTLKVLSVTPRRIEEVLVTLPESRLEVEER
ncbi:gliding motility-associated protein GldE [Neolewinella antarctica]|uniref:Gliding motility-associated protein GldE n=1 Tax=Neolewinella antarctica TaxID=442734 RepID=A0ABX0XF90_9BACT|nr:gliding motility-associated protein GldE [Neolewinella antarctica]NJC27901.1 gliding motility-associated protein GldE [Neolewinella antarctica]